MPADSSGMPFNEGSNHTRLSRGLFAIRYGRASHVKGSLRSISYFATPRKPGQSAINSAKCLIHIDLEVYHGAAKDLSELQLDLTFALPGAGYRHPQVLGCRLLDLRQETTFADHFIENNSISYDVWTKLQFVDLLDERTDREYRFSELNRMALGTGLENKIACGSFESGLRLASDGHLALQEGHIYSVPLCVLLHYPPPAHFTTLASPLTMDVTFAYVRARNARSLTCRRMRVLKALDVLVSHGPAVALSSRYPAYKRSEIVKTYAKPNLDPNSSGYYSANHRAQAAAVAGEPAITTGTTRAGPERRNRNAMGGLSTLPPSGLAEVEHVSTPVIPAECGTHRVALKGRRVRIASSRRRTEAELPQQGQEQQQLPIPLLPSRTASLETRPRETRLVQELRRMPSHHLFKASQPGSGVPEKKVRERTKPPVSGLNLDLKTAVLFGQQPRSPPLAGKFSPAESPRMDNISSGDTAIITELDVMIDSVIVQMFSNDRERFKHVLNREGLLPTIAAAYALLVSEHGDAKINQVCNFNAFELKEAIYSRIIDLCDSDPIQAGNELQKQQNVVTSAEMRLDAPIRSAAAPTQFYTDSQRAPQQALFSHNQSEVETGKSGEALQVRDLQNRQSEAKTPLKGSTVVTTRNDTLETILPKIDESSPHKVLAGSVPPSRPADDTALLRLEHGKLGPSILIDTIVSDMCAARRGYFRIALCHDGWRRLANSVYNRLQDIYGQAVITLYWSINHQEVIRVIMSRLAVIYTLSFTEEERNMHRPRA